MSMSTTSMGCSVPPSDDPLRISDAEKLEETESTKSRRSESMQEEFLVDWDGPDDPANPQNWSNRRRWFITIAASFLIMNASLASVAPTGIIKPLTEEFQMPDVVTILTVSLFVSGFCVGPLLWGPLSEHYGRRPIYIIGFFAFTAFQVGCALAKNSATILACRFLGGTFAAVPTTNSGAIIADLWAPRERGNAMAFFSVTPFLGPALGPIISGYMYAAGLQWQWTFWVLTILGAISFVLVLIGLPETYSPVILAKRAKALREETGDERYYTHFARERAQRTWSETISYIIAKPFKVLFLEVMMILITLYMSFIYGIQYLLFVAYPVVFVEGQGVNPGEAGLFFFPFFGGGVVGTFLCFWVFDPRYQLKVKSYSPEPVPPEARLEMAIWAGPMFVVSFFWFGFTTYDTIPPWIPASSGLLVGCSMTMLMMSMFSSIVDAYTIVAASALAGCAVVRSLVGAIFPLFAKQMYVTLNPRIASTLLGCLSLLMLPIPILLQRYGSTLRRRSKYAPTK